jgi:pyruvate/2-oxoglutarate dehydrogenase complex dihydrolipoamide acyltransferase (E2) component
LRLIATQLFAEIRKVKRRVPSPEMPMPNRPAKFVSTISTTVLAGALLATLAHGGARAADECLSAPKDETPAGSHWYYRLDHASKRHCWYLREEGERLSQAAVSNSSPPAKPIAPKAEAAPQRSLADARAELPAQTPVETPRRDVARPPAVAADPAVGEDNGATGTAAGRSIVASRWPGQSDAAPSFDPAPAQADSGTRGNSPPPAQPPAILAAGQFAAADAPAQTRGYSVRMQLAALLGALALAGMIGTVVFKSTGARRLRQARIRPYRGPVWQPTDDDSILLSPQPDALPRRPGFAREPDPGAERNDRISEFFAQLSKRTAG